MMNFMIKAAMTAVTAMTAIAMPVAAMIVNVPLEDRLAESHVVAVGAITMIDDGTAIDDESEPRQPTITITLARVLKGPADLKEVRMACRKDPTTEIHSIRPAPPVYRMGQERIWQLKQSEIAADLYVDAFPHFIEPAERADVIAAVLAGLNNPMEAINAPDKPDATADDKALAERTRLSAAYCLVRGGKPETAFPFRQPKPTEEADGAAGLGNAVRDTSGYLPLDPAVLDRVMAIAIASFASTEESETMTSQTILRKVGCPLHELNPDRDGVNIKPQTPEERQKTREAWARAIAAWWADGKNSLKFYLPDPAAKKTPAKRLPEVDNGSKNVAPGESFRLQMQRP